jgi:hypothetical protein
MRMVGRELFGQAPKERNMDRQHFDAIERSNPQAGANYLIAKDGTVYEVVMWALGGVADRRVHRRGDPNYMTYRMQAEYQKNTLFEVKHG